MAGCGTGNSIYASSEASLAAPVSASPATLSFTALGPNAALPVAVSQPGFDGPFTAQTSDAGVATVAGPSGAPGSFVVTPVGGGTATIAFYGAHGQSAAVTVTVTTATLVPQSERAR